MPHAFLADVMPLNTSVLLSDLGFIVFRDPAVGLPVHLCRRLHSHWFWSLLRGITGIRGAQLCLGASDQG